MDETKKRSQQRQTHYKGKRKWCLAEFCANNEKFMLLQEKYFLLYVEEYF